MEKKERMEWVWRKERKENRKDDKEKKSREKKNAKSRLASVLIFDSQVIEPLVGKRQCEGVTTGFLHSLSSGFFRYSCPRPA